MDKGGFSFVSILAWILGFLLLVGLVGLLILFGRVLDISAFLCLIAVNAVLYFVMKLIFYRPDMPGEPVRQYAPFVEVLLELLFGILMVASLPGSLLFSFVDERHANRIYDVVQEKMKRVRIIAEYRGEPSAFDVRCYGFDVSSFKDESGAFDLFGWKEHEYEKLGLSSRRW